MNFNNCSTDDLHQIDARLQAVRHKCLLLSQGSALDRDQQRRLDEAALAIGEVQHFVTKRLLDRAGININTGF